MKTVDAVAPAKVNLTLHVTGQRGDGYHELDSLVVFAASGDRLKIQPADALSLEVTGPMAAGVPRDSRNIVWKAAEAAGVRASITLDKRLPNAAGLGGGSADAAALLRVADQVGGHVPADVLALGADVPVCLNVMSQHMQGIGEILRPVRLPAAHLVLVNPGVEVPTGAVFEALDRRDNAPMSAIPETTSFQEFARWLRLQRNDLQTSAIGIAPVIQRVLNMMQSAPVARMTGSGATCFALMQSASAAQSLARHLKHWEPDWWVTAAPIMEASI